MSDLHQALGEIHSIRRHLARTTQFRGYGPATLAVTAALALIAAALQPHTPHYLTLWLTTATLSAALTLTQMVTRTRRLHSGLSNEMLRTAAEQFLPAALAGLLLTAVLAHLGETWLLPGLWQIVYALGIFASCRFLPRAMLAAAAWYLLTGLTVLSLGEPHALAPWTMGLPFTAGQLLIAAILYTSPQEPADEC